MKGLEVRSMCKVGTSSCQIPRAPGHPADSCKSHESVNTTSRESFSAVDAKEACTTMSTSYPGILAVQRLKLMQSCLFQQ